MALSHSDARLLAMVRDQNTISGRSNYISTRGIHLTDAEAEAIMEAYQTEEEKEKSWSRRFVENYLQHVS